MRVTLVVGLLASLLFSAAQASAAPRRPPSQLAQAADVLRAYQRWRGGSRFMRMRTAHFVGTQTSQGSAERIERWTSVAGTYRMDSGVGDNFSSVRVGPSGSWNLMFSGQVQSLTPEERAIELRVGRILMPLTDADELGRARLVRNETVRGRRNAVVEMRDLHGDGLDYFIEPNGVLTGVRLHVDGKTRSFTYRDWRKVGGVRMPFREVATDRDGDEVRTIFTSVTPNVAPRSATFDRPEPRVSVTFRRLGRADWLPFAFFEGERIFIDARVNGKPVSVLLDSGAEASVLDRAFLDTLGLADGVNTVAKGFNATTAASIVQSVSIDLGTVEMRGLTVASIDLSTVASQLRHPLPMILGAEIFREAVVDIDFAGRRIAFEDPASFSPPQGAIAASVTADNGLYLIGAMIAGKPARLEFDLGSGAPLTLWRSFWSRFPLPQRRSTTLIGGVGGTGEAGIADVPHINIGGADFASVPTILMPDAGQGSSIMRSDGNVGLPLLKRFRLIVDLPHSQIWFVGPADVTTPFAKDRSGLATGPATIGRKVLHVAAGSPSAGARVTVGDTVLTIDGVDAAAPSKREWNTEPAGTQHLLMMGDGRTIIITLADYF